MTSQMSLEEGNAYSGPLLYRMEASPQNGKHLTGRDSPFRQATKKTIRGKVLFAVGLGKMEHLLLAEDEKAGAYGPAKSEGFEKKLCGALINYLIIGGVTRFAQ